MINTILVTGGTGYIGSWVVKGLLEKGHTVRLAVRDASKKEKYQFLNDIANTTDGTLEIWEANLLTEGSFDKAVEGCNQIAHLASPFILNVKDPQRDLVDPAVKGTANVLEAANKSSTVKKIVLTSSVVAIFGDNIDMKHQSLDILTEKQFNTTSSLTHQPYAFSKISAEKKAWEIYKGQSQWELSVMNPAFVMGPSLAKNSKSESLKIMNDLLSGKFKSGTPDLDFCYVDVRDVAKAHIYGLENKTEGRHILSERIATFLDLANIIRNEFGDKYKLPTKNVPNWLLKIIGPSVGLTRKFVRNNVGHSIKLDNSKSKDKLNMQYIPLEKTIKDMVVQMNA